MASVNIAGMRELESSAIQSGWSEELLMDLAGRRLADSIARFFPVPGHAIGYLGKGHNAADTLIALRFLREKYGWLIAVRPAFTKERCTELTRRKWDECQDLSVFEGPLPWRDLNRPLVLLDGLVGIGARGDLRPPLATLASEMRALRETCGATVAAVDLPSGTDPDSGEISVGGVIADVTFMIGAAKLGLLKGRSSRSTGALALVHVEPLKAPSAGEMQLIAPQSLQIAKSPRGFDFHKGKAGRVGLFVGSSEYTGAAVLAAIGALRAGAGLITIHTHPSAAETISRKCPPEIMIQPCADPLEMLNNRYDSLVIGCGLGTLDNRLTQSIFELLSKTALPVVIDADALNAIAEANRLDLLKPNHVITPHPGEFRRLAPDLADSEREEAVRRFTQRSPSTILLKGSRTIVSSRDFPLFCNSTGNPGMASGGQGDLLSGVIGARLAIGDGTVEAASFSAWLCGRAAEHAANRSSISAESLTASDVAGQLGAAFLDWRAELR